MTAIYAMRTPEAVIISIPSDYVTYAEYTMLEHFFMHTTYILS